MLKEKKKIEPIVLCPAKYVLRKRGKGAGGVA
jgi:hypothetical protein